MSQKEPKAIGNHSYLDLKDSFRQYYPNIILVILLHFALNIILIVLDLKVATNRILQKSLLFLLFYYNEQRNNIH